MIGKRIGPYEIVEEIGKGGMATVYRAYQPNLDRFVAVKIIHRAIALDSASLERFQREARLLTRLVHPHLLPIYDYDATSDTFYIVLQQSFAELKTIITINHDMYQVNFGGRHFIEKVLSFTAVIFKTGRHISPKPVEITLTISILVNTDLVSGQYLSGSKSSIIHSFTPLVGL